MEAGYSSAMKRSRLSVQRTVIAAFSLCLLVSFSLYPSADRTAPAYPPHDASSAVVTSGATKKTALRRASQQSVSKAARSKSSFTNYSGLTALHTAPEALAFSSVVLFDPITLSPHHARSDVTVYHTPRAPPDRFLHG